MKAPETLRADAALVAAGLSPSRAKAREAIEAGHATVNGARIVKPSTPVAADARLAADPLYPWVSRGGVKLAAALDHFEVDPSRRNCLDVGSSTGGFTHVLLSRGASHVTAVDVGHGQLHASLLRNHRVSLLEGRDARGLVATDLIGPPSLLTFDVSFISLRLVLRHVFPLAAASAQMIALIKPQFEAGRARAPKGIVRDRSVHAEVCASIAADVVNLGWTVRGVMPSPIEGGDGNREFLLAAER